MPPTLPTGPTGPTGPHAPAPGGRGSAAVADGEAPARAAGVRLALVWLGVAVWSVGLLVVANVVPLYAGTTTTLTTATDGGPVDVTTERVSATLVEINGPGALADLLSRRRGRLLVALLLADPRAAAGRRRRVAARRPARGLQRARTMPVLPVTAAVVLACAARSTGNSPVSAGASAARRPAG